MKLLKDRELKETRTRQAAVMENILDLVRSIDLILYLKPKAHNVCTPTFMDLIDPIKTGRILQKISLFDLRNVSNKYLVARLQYLVKDDPICFPILNNSQYEDRIETYR